ncbi:MAG: Lrp/AsnC family transcriptional regulator [Candidatus Micrarchaeota archaeon]|nr:Lrp/AsnC family transcriptional regulator [Candidatus Micrarchaeota archaeon]
MKFDSTDRKLLFLLDQNARATLTELASQLNCSRETINYRINKMVKEGVIHSFLTKINFEKLGLVNYIVYIKLSNLHPKEHSKLIDELSKEPVITWVASLGGRFDLAIEITAPSISEFNEYFSELLDRHKNHIVNYQISTRVFQYTFGKKYLWLDKIEKIKKVSVIQTPEAIDILDKTILSAIAYDARASVVEIGNKINEPATTVAFRLRKLETKNVIEGYTTFSTIKEFGYSRFKALITVRYFSKSQEEEFSVFCQSHPNIYYYTKTLGNWNFEIEVDVESPQKYQQFLIDFRSHFSDIIQDIESLSIFEEHKFGFWPG